MVVYESHCDIIRKEDDRIAEKLADPLSKER